MADKWDREECISGKTNGRKAERQKLYCIEKDPKSMGVKI